MKPITLLLCLLTLCLVGCTNRNSHIDQKEKLDKWTDSIRAIHFDTQLEFDSTRKTQGKRFREYSYSKNTVQYLLIDNLDTLVKVLTIKNPDLQIINEFCITNKNEKHFEKIIYNGKINGRLLEINCNSNDTLKEYYTDGLAIK